MKVAFTQREFDNLLDHAMWVCKGSGTVIMIIDEYPNDDTYSVYSFVGLECADCRTGLTYEGAIEAVQTQMFEENAHLAA